MARGWESKAVETQIEDATKGSDLHTERLNSEQAELRQRRDGLLLTRTRILQDLQTARNPRYRDMLQASLAHVERQLAELS